MLFSVGFHGSTIRLIEACEMKWGKKIRIALDLFCATILSVIVAKYPNKIVCGNKIDDKKK